MTKPRIDWPRASQSIRPQRTYTLVKPGALDNRDLKMRSYDEAKTERYIKFGKVWNAGTSLAQVAQTLGMTKEKARTMAMYLREHNVPLKKFPRRSSANFEEVARAIAPDDAPSLTAASTTPPLQPQ